jgi:hypothetical protein
VTTASQGGIANHGLERPRVLVPTPAGPLARAARGLPPCLESPRSWNWRITSVEPRHLIREHAATRAWLHVGVDQTTGHAMQAPLTSWGSPNTRAFSLLTEGSVLLADCATVSRLLHMPVALAGYRLYVRLNDPPTSGTGLCDPASLGRMVRIDRLDRPGWESSSLRIRCGNRPTPGGSSQVVPTQDQDPSKWARHHDRWSIVWCDGKEYRPDPRRRQKRQG